MSISEDIRATSLEITETHLVVELEDGSRHRAPISLFPILADATPDERRQWEFVASATGIHWPAIDEDVSVFSIVHPDRTRLMNARTVDAIVDNNRARRARRSG